MVQTETHASEGLKDVQVVMMSVIAVTAGVAVPEAVQVHVPEIVQPLVRHRIVRDDV